MDRNHQLAVGALVVDLLSGYPSMLNASEATVSAYVRPLLTLHIEAVKMACDRFSRGEVPGQKAGWPPTAPELYLEAQKHHAAIDSRGSQRSTREVPEGYRLTADGTHLIIPIGKPVPPGWDCLPAGTTVDHGHGRIDLGGLSAREARVIDRMGGITPDGKNFALMSMEEKRAEIGRYLPPPVAA